MRLKHWQSIACTCILLSILQLAGSPPTSQQATQKKLQRISSSPVNYNAMQLLECKTSCEIYYQGKYYKNKIKSKST